MTSSIALGTFKQQVQGAKDGAELRLGQNDGLTTAKRGLGGRIVRFFKPELDQADTRRIAGQLLRGLQTKYGAEIGLEAFRLARQDTRVDEKGGVFIKTGKPLTARQVRDALDYARSLSQSEQRTATLSGVQGYAPENKAGFKKVLQDQNIDGGQLSKAHKAFYKERLHEQVLAATEQNGGTPLASKDIRKIAGKVLAYTASLDRSELGEQMRGWEQTRTAGRVLAFALAGRGGELVGPGVSRTDAQDPGRALVHFLELSDARLKDVALGGSKGGAGGDDLADARFAVRDNLMSSLSPREAKELYLAAMAPGSAARTLLYALNSKASDPKLQLDMHRTAAVRELAVQLSEFVKALGARAGIKDAPGQVDKIADAGLSINFDDLAGMEGKLVKQKGISFKEAQKVVLGMKQESFSRQLLDPGRLQDAGIDGRRVVAKALGQAETAIDLLADVLKRNEEEAVGNERLAMERELEDEPVKTPQRRHSGSEDDLTFLG